MRGAWPHFSLLCLVQGCCFGVTGEMSHSRCSRHDAFRGVTDLQADLDYFVDCSSSGILTPAEHESYKVRCYNTITLENDIHLAEIKIKFLEQK